MKIYIFRHAQKDHSFSDNPDLTTKGLQQALHLWNLVSAGELPRPELIWVSPKKRTHSTMRAIAQNLGLELKVNPNLEEQQSHETLGSFHRRIRHTLEELQNQRVSCVFLCSHYDWLVESMGLIPSDKDLGDNDFLQWSPAQHIGFNLNSDGIFEYLELKRIEL